LSHENTDIAVDTIDVIRELTDEDVGAEEEELEEGEEAGEGSKVRMAMAEFIDELVGPYAVVIVLQ
jgi:beta-catenin-like protein 1